MYSNNDYRYYLEHQLLTSGGCLSHHGVMGMKWGIRRYQSYATVPRKSGEGGKETGLAKKKTKLENKKAKNSAKIAKYQKELAKPKSQKELARIAKYERKVNKINASSITRRAKKHRMRYGEATPLGEIQLFRLAGAQNKLAKAHGKTDKYKVKIADLEYKNSKIDKKLGKIETKQKVNEINKQRNTELDVFKNTTDPKTFKNEVKQTNRYWDDQVRVAKGKKRKQDDDYAGKRYDRELIDLALLDASYEQKSGAVKSKSKKKRR